MNEEMMKKLVEALKSRGLSDEDIESVKLELTEKTEDKKSPEEPKGDDVPTPPAEESKVEEEAKVEEKEEKPAETDEAESKVEEKVEEVKEESKVDEVSPTEELEEKPAEEGKLPEGVKEFDPENPVVPEPTPEVPATPDYEAQYNEMKSLLEEERKAREGLQVRLEDALKALEESGVIRPSGKPASNIGVDDPTRVDDLHEQETTMGAVLKDINTY